MDKEGAGIISIVSSSQVAGSVMDTGSQATENKVMADRLYVLFDGLDFLTRRLYELRLSIPILDRLNKDKVAIQRIIASLHNTEEVCWANRAMIEEAIETLQSLWAKVERLTIEIEWELIINEIEATRSKRITEDLERVIEGYRKDIVAIQKEYARIYALLVEQAEENLRRMAEVLKKQEDLANMLGSLQDLQQQQIVSHQKMAQGLNTATQLVNSVQRTHFAAISAVLSTLPPNLQAAYQSSSNVIRQGKLPDESILAHVNRMLPALTTQHVVLTQVEQSYEVQIASHESAITQQAEFLDTSRKQGLILQTKKTEVDARKSDVEQRINKEGDETRQAELKKELEALRQESATLSGNIRENEEKIKAAEAAIEESNAKLVDLQKKSKDLQRDLIELSAEIAVIQEEKNRSEVLLEKERLLREKIEATKTELRRYGTDIKATTVKMKEQEQALKGMRQGRQALTVELMDEKLKSKEEEIRTLEAKLKSLGTDTEPTEVEREAMLKLEETRKEYHDILSPPAHQKRSLSDELPSEELLKKSVVTLPIPSAPFKPIDVVKLEPLLPQGGDWPRFAREEVFGQMAVLRENLSQRVGQTEPERSEPDKERQKYVI